MNIGRASLKLFFTQAGRSLLLFLGIIYFARELGPDQLGSFFLFQALTGLLRIPSDLGISGALEKRLSEGEHLDRLLGSALVMKITLMALVSVGVLLASSQVNRYIGIDLAVYLALSIPLFEFSNFFVKVLRGELRVGETAVIRFALRFIWIVLGAILVELGHGVRGLVVSFLFAGVITAVWGYWRCETSIGTPTIEQTRSLVEYSKFQAISSIGGRVYQWTDVAIIGFFLAQLYVSSYEVAWQVTLLVLLVSKSISWTIFPQISRWDVESATDKIESTITRALGFALFVSIPALIGGTIFASDILEFLFGSEYAIASLVLVILLVEKLFQSIHDIIESSVRALDRPDMAAKATVVAVLLNVVLNVILVVSIGFVGAAIATMLSWLVNTSLHAYYLNRLVTVTFPVPLIGWYVLASFIMGGTLLFVKSVVSITNVLVLFSVIAFGVVVYGALTAAVPRIRNQIFEPVIREFV